MKKRVSFLVPGQSGSNLFLFSFPHIHSAATFCLKATLSHEHSLRPLLSDEGRENREAERIVIKAQYYKHRRGNRAGSWQRSQNDWGKMKRVKHFWSRQRSKKCRQNDKQMTTGARNNLIHYSMTHLHLYVPSTDLIFRWLFRTLQFHRL